MGHTIHLGNCGPGITVANRLVDDAFKLHATKQHMMDDTHDTKCIGVACL